MSYQDEYCASEPCLICGSTLEKLDGECAVCGDFDKAEMGESSEHTCSHCGTPDPIEECDSCEGCDECLDFCSQCENSICINCCEGHSEENDNE